MTDERDENEERVRAFFQEFVEKFFPTWYRSDEEERVEFVFDLHEWFACHEGFLYSCAREYLDALSSVGLPQVETLRDRTVWTAEGPKQVVERVMYVGPYEFGRWAYEVTLTGDEEEDEDARLRAEARVLPHPPQLFAGLGTPLPGFDRGNMMWRYLPIPEFFEDDDDGAQDGESGGTESDG